MSVISIGTNNYADALRERLFFELQFLQEDGIDIEIDEINQSDTVIFKCQYNGRKEEYLLDLFKEYIANVLSDVIINSLEDNLLRKILYNEHKYFSTKEEDQVLETAYDRLNFLVSQDNEEVVSKIQRKNRIFLEIIDYLELETEIILEGFVRFRLKNYLTELEVAIDGAVEDYLVEKEYKEFVHLLKNFIDDQAPKNKIVNVVKIEDDNFQLLDHNGIVLDNIFLDEYILQMVDEELASEDLLISSLITIAPEEIILHFKEPISVVKTLESVFTDRLSICLGCQYCELSDFSELE
ncbi:putative sporulation protein YtxC [Halanaerocella petrolearia]